MKWISTVGRNFPQSFFSIFLHYKETKLISQIINFSLVFNDVQEWVVEEYQLVNVLHEFLEHTLYSGRWCPTKRTSVDERLHLTSSGMKPPHSQSPYGVLFHFPRILNAAKLISVCTLRMCSGLSPSSKPSTSDRKSLKVDRTVRCGVERLTSTLQDTASLFRNPWDFRVSTVLFNNQCFWMLFYNIDRQWGMFWYL